MDVKSKPHGNLEEPFLPLSSRFHLPLRAAWPRGHHMPPGKAFEKWEESPPHQPKDLKPRFQAKLIGKPHLENV
jgi:hypothetical protein